MNIKNLLLAASFSMFAFGVTAQDDKQAQDINQQEAPQAVVETFNEEFAAAEDVDWEKRGDTYEVEFEIKEKKEAYFSSDGELEMVSTEIDRDELPQTIDQKLDQQQYQDYDFEEFSRIEKGGETYYKVEAEKDGQTEKLKFNSSGEEIQKGEHKKGKKGQRG